MKPATRNTQVLTHNNVTYGVQMGTSDSDFHKEISGIEEKLEIKNRGIMPRKRFGYDARRVHHSPIDLHLVERHGGEVLYFLPALERITTFIRTREQSQYNRVELIIKELFRTGEELATEWNDEGFVIFTQGKNLGLAQMLYDSFMDGDAVVTRHDKETGFSILSYQRIPENIKEAYRSDDLSSYAPRFFPRVRAY